jgi:hypothetical protein
VLSFLSNVTLGGSKLLFFQNLSISFTESGSIHHIIPGSLQYNVVDRLDISSVSSSSGP